MYESQDEMVSHPSHYQSKSGLEVIDVIEAFTENLTGIEATDTGNIIKYACRWKEKNGIQDLEKIMWYTQHLIDHLKSRKNEFETKETQYVSYLGFEYEHHLFTEVEFDSVLNQMEQLLDSYGYVTLADFYDLAGSNSHYVDSKYGWTNLNSVKKFRSLKDKDLYYFGLPQPILIK